MTEEVVNEVIENKTEEVVPNIWETKAIEQGWRPKEEWEGNPDEWRPAKEFVERGELFSKISSQSSELKDLRKTLNALMEHHQKVQHTEYQRALSDLKNQKREALLEGDPDKVIEVDEQIATLKENKPDQNATGNNVARQPTKLFVEFVKTNPWYATDVEMRQFADEVGIGYFNTHPHATEEETYAHVVTRVKKQFTDKFQRRSTPSPVEGVGSPGKTPQSKEYPLTEDERRTMMTFVRNNVMTKEKYIEELKKIKGES